MLGMRIAQLLVRQGCAVSLFESAPDFGGLASAWRLGDLTWDRHYHVILLSDVALRGLLDELGLEKEIRWVITRTGFYTDGRLYSMSNVMEFLQFPPLRLTDKLRLGATIFYASRISNWSRLEQIPVADWLRKYSGKRAFEKVWLPLLRAKLGENYRHTSAAFIWATIARMYAARRAGLKKEMFGYVPGGYARILERYAAKLREEGIGLITGMPAVRIGSGANGKVKVDFAGGRCAEFDGVVGTMPSHAATKLCPELSDCERQAMSAIRYMGVLCPSLLLRKPLGGYYVTNITEPAVPFTAIIEMSALVDPAEFGQRHLVYLPKYLPPDDPLFQETDEAIRTRFLEALLRIHPHIGIDDVLAFQVSRTRYVVPLTTLNYSAGVAPMKTSIPGLWLVNSTHIRNGTLNVNETLQLAHRASMLLARDPRAGAA